MTLPDQLTRPDAAKKAEPRPLSELLGMAEMLAYEASAAAWSPNADPEHVATEAHGAVALAAASRAFSDLAIARMRAGDRLELEEPDPREQLRRRAGRTQ